MEGEDEEVRGVKRKAEDHLAASPRKIQALSQDVVNKIAAGEIIVAPVHALKELLENSVDSGSTSIEVLVKDGGLKLLQITDNGHGINKDDLSILCERFTTSKLKAFEDLSSIGTYGFRGEALASISHIAHLTVTTRTKESSCAWRASYQDGKLVPLKVGQSHEPKATAGRQGTQMTVEDLFYNVPTRRRAFRSTSEEYAKILDLVGRYGVHCHQVAFSCKKHGESSMGLALSANASIADRIRQVYGSSVANELIELDVINESLGMVAKCYVSNANCNVKRTTLLLFINHRSVESSAIKKAIEQTYAAFLPKGAKPFVYLNLEIDPARVDVNVHPTKREVNFLNEDEIIEEICDEIRRGLDKVDTSRIFMTQTLLSNTNSIIPTISADTERSEAVASTSRKAVSAPKTPASKPYENNLVRTDSRVRKITSMLRAGPHTPLVRTSKISNTSLRPADSTDDGMQYTQNDRDYVSCRFDSVKSLRAEVREQMHNELTNMVACHTFVGIVDESRRIVALQGGVKLYLIDYGMFCKDFFYQIGLTDFGNFGTIRFEPSLNLRDLLSVAAASERDKAGDEGNDIDWEGVVDTVQSQLIDKREMMAEYFSVDISEDGELFGIPILIKGYTPSMAKLPQFLLRLGPHVDWTQEKECFHTFLTELALFYAPECLPPAPSPAANPTEAASSSLQADMPGAESDAQGEDVEIIARRTHVKHALEFIIFPALKARFIATRGLLKGVVEVANLKGLYRVFERC